jgi:predicted transcriptional regulator
VRDALLSSDPKEQVVGEFTATLILALQEGLPLEQRAVELETVYRNHPEVSDYLEGRAVGLVHEISVLLKGAES